MEQTYPNTLRVKSLGIDTHGENTIFMHANCDICISEGFTAMTRVRVHYQDRSIIATLNVVYSQLIGHREASLSMEAFKSLGIQEGDYIHISHLKPIDSLSKVRAKMYGKELSNKDFTEIINDISLGHYSNIELAAFISACSGENLSVNEIIGLTKAMINTGQKIRWSQPLIMDKHCVGGLPGNRTTPIAVSIAATAGLTIPKSSSRAITSPAGTADMMETMCPVDLSIEQIKNVIAKENGCIIWGGGVKLSPVDDILISIEKALDVDSEGQMVASVLSKKAAAGSTHVLIDIPVGETAKVRSQEEALRLQYYFKAASKEIGIEVETIITDGSQPVGRGIGPALEAMDVLSVLRNEPDCSSELKRRSLQISGKLLELSGKYPAGAGEKVALDILESGQALKKFMAICEAQGGFREPVFARYKYDVVSDKDGVIKSINNRKLAKIAKLAGAPLSSSAGIQYWAPLGKEVKKGDLLFSIYSGAIGELEYAKEYMINSNGVISIG